VADISLEQLQSATRFLSATAFMAFGRCAAALR